MNVPQGKGTAEATIREERYILGALLVFALLYRLLTLMPIHSGVDERDYWTAAKALAQGLPYPELTHRTVRVSVIWPVAFFQRILGTGPNVYYVTPLLNSAVQAGLAYVLGRRLRGRLAGFIAAFALLAFPYMIRAGSQVRPEIFSMTYILAALLCLHSYLERNAREAVPLLAGALWLFLAYESKITNLFFLPGFALAIFASKRKAGHALLFCAVLFGLYLIETGIYALATDFRFGQLQVILGSHLSDDAPDIAIGGVLDLFKRYARPYLQPYWQAPFLAFAPAAAFYLRKKGDRPVKALIAAAASFFLFVTFAVKSVSPIVPAEDFINRYFCAVLGPVFLVLAVAAVDILAYFRKKAWIPSPRQASAVLAVILLATVAALSADRRPPYARGFGASPARIAEHPLVLNGEYRRKVTAAYRDGLPIVAVDSNGGSNALSACEAFYLDGRGELPVRVPFLGPAGNPLLAWGRPGAAAPPPGDTLAAVRNPFRLRRLAAGELGALTDGRFPGESGRASSER